MIVLKIQCLGPFQVQWAGKPVERFDTLKNRALLAYLAIEGETPLSRDFLAGLLWPDFPNAIALRNLRLALFNLRQALNTQIGLQGNPAALPDPILSSRLTIQFNPQAPVWVDAKEFEGQFGQTRKHLHASLEGCTECIEKLEQAASYYQGDFLEGFYLKEAEEFMEWLMLRRAHLQQLMLDSLDQLCRNYLRQAERAGSEAGLKRAVENSLNYSRRALQIEPLRETAYIHLMKALALQGKKQEALSQFEICRKILASELAVGPEEEIIQLCAQIRSDLYPPHLQLFTPAGLLSSNRYALPIQLTPLIGREAQLERLIKLLFSYRWVTLVGEGGVGKTRLAVSAAQKVAEKFPDGVFFLQLAEVTPSKRVFGDGQSEDRQAVQEALLQAIASACDLSMQQDGSDVERLFTVLQPRKTLLILDSFEHLSSGADILLDLLTHTPQLHILVTTRQSLYFQAGSMMRIDGLPIPQDDQDPEGEQYASVQLFLERVTRLYSDYHHTGESLPWINRICRLLDGIPLAIELAAPWVDKLPLEMIAHAIEYDLDFLTNSMAGLLERHHSMRAVCESSWMLLKPGEKRALVCSANFKNGFSYEEITNRCQVSFQEIEGLVDKNLLIKTEPRQYRMHEILRQFVLEKSVESSPPKIKPLPSLKRPAFIFASPEK